MPTTSLAAMAPPAILLLVLTVAAVIFVTDGARAIGFRYSMDYGEAPLLDQTLRLARLEPIYHADLSAPPYTVSNYPPLYPLILSPIARLAGAAFWYGRLVSWLAILAAAGLLGLILHAITRDHLAAVVGGLALLAFPPVAYWSSLYRVDALALALSLGGVCCCARRPDGRFTVLVAALLLTAAIYTRQSYGLAAPLAAALWLLQTAGWRRALSLVGLVAALGGALFVGLELGTGGAFSVNVVGANLNEYRPGTLFRYLADLWALMPLALIASGAFLLSAWWFDVRSWRLIAPYVVGAVLSALTIGKVGSNVNYLFELGAAMSLSLGGLLAWLRPRRLAHAVVAGLLALDAALMVAASPYRAVAYAQLAHAEDARRLLALVHQAPGVVLADEDTGLLVLDGRPLYLQPFEMTQLARAGRWDQRPLVREIERQAFAAILIFRIPDPPLHRERWTDEMLAAIDRAYASTERIGATEVYRPRAAAEPAVSPSAATARSARTSDRP